jgi:hypothetical protein
MFLKNTAGQKLKVFAFTMADNTPKTGDAANITAYVDKDHAGLTVLGDTSATEIDATNGKGYYLFDLTQAETNAEQLDFTAKSSTSGVMVIAVPATVFTSVVPITAGTGTGQLNVSGGRADADVKAQDGIVNATRRPILFSGVLPAQTLGSSTSVVLPATAQANDGTTTLAVPSDLSAFSGCEIAVTAGTGAGQRAFLVGGTAAGGRVANIAPAWGVQPGTGANFELRATECASASPASGGASAAWLNLLGLLTAAMGGKLWMLSSDDGIVDGSNYINRIRNTVQNIDDTVRHADYGNAKLVRSTTPANTLDVAATGEAGIDWSNIKAPTTTVTLTGTTVGTITTYTGNTPQTGDVYGKLGAKGGLPILDAVNGQVLLGYSGAALTIGTVTNLTNLPAIPNNWLTAAGIAANALDSKGNWVTSLTGIATATDVSTLATTLASAHGSGSWATATGFALATSLPTNFSSLVISNAGVVSASATVSLTEEQIAAIAAGIAGQLSDPWVIVLPGEYAPGTAGYLIGHSGGLAPKPGAYTDTIRIDAPGTTTPLEGVWVWVNTVNDAGADTGTTVWGKEATDGNGIVTAQLDAGTYWVHAAKPGYMFDTTWPKKLTVTAEGFTWA